MFVCGYLNYGVLLTVFILFRQSQATTAQAEKKHKVYEKAIEDLKHKVADVQSEVEMAQKECRNQASEVYRLRTQIDESNEAMDMLRKENKHLMGRLFVYL